MGFECRICGTCCMYLGDYIVIEKQTNKYRFDCCCISTGTSFSAEVDPDKRDRFDDTTFPDQNPTACRFLRPLGEGIIGCTIHTDSPAQCKYYRCRIMDIFSLEGNERGYITGTLALHSSDSSLRDAYDTIMKGISGPGEEAEEQIRAGLIKAGYEVR
ncbi:hypothetical protein [uncultured Methanospirillum sp.]|uniref:hypothetical protein n=1 Tax=uncultured Methanospirillum sp. TaxID=262503 RepID=UPI0029C8973A|nr:hypothetical protein [uncultured Methanospirillum sp.]